jgi:hypothetical protein
MEMGREQIERVLSNGWAPLRDAEGFVEEATNHPDYRVCGLDVAVDGFGLVVTVEVTRGEGRASVAFRLGSARVGCRTATLAASARTLPDPLAEEVWAEVEERVAMVLSCQAMGVTSVQDAQEGGGEVFGVALGPGGGRR